MSCCLSLDEVAPALTALTAGTSEFALLFAGNLVLFCVKLLDKRESIFLMQKGQDKFSAAEILESQVFVPKKKITKKSRS